MGLSKTSKWVLKQNNVSYCSSMYNVLASASKHCLLFEKVRSTQLFGKICIYVYLAVYMDERFLGVRCLTDTQKNA